jgi:hypothetical protein
MMRLAFVLAVGLAACVNEDTQFPIVTQGGNPGAGGGGTTTTTTIAGRVCLVNDPRFLTQCVTTGVDGLTVTLTTPTTTSPVTTTTTTTANGSFVITTPTTTVATAPTTFTITGPTIVPSTQTLVTGVNIPVLSQQLFDQIALANGINLNENTGTGTIIASVNRAGTPVSGVTVVATPNPAFGPFFDGTSPTGFTLNGTGAAGVSLLSGFHSGPVNLTFNDAGLGTETQVGGVQVVDGGITFVEGVLP